MSLTDVQAVAGRPPAFRLPVLAEGHPCAGIASAQRLVLAALGVVPVTLLAVSTFGVGLRGMAAHVALPAVAVLAVICARQRSASTLVGSALVMGLSATALYDLSRFGFIAAGVVHHDPIPHIGTALGMEPAVVVGYLWRYAGNGTGLALAFLAGGLRGVRAGVIYGLGVCGGLFLTLAVSPFGQEILFPLTAGTVVMATTGHAIFGAVIGWLSETWHGTDRNLE